MKEIILDVRFPKQKNGRVIFECGDRVRLTSEHVVLFTATLPPQIRPKIGRNNCMKNIRVMRPLDAPPHAAISAAIRRGMESNRFWMSACGREFHIACLRNKVRLLKLQDADQELDANQPSPPTYIQTF
ncbi:uncharacterized protein TNCV_3026191 [Trichonephila clavipes]|nr:uncharacterized protein TNCV_3026191 [Trichonephila clavipes]